MLPTLISEAAATTRVVFDIVDPAIRWPTTRKTTKLHKAAITKALRRMVNSLRFIQISIERLG
jgi:hypothetical protein